MSDPRPVDAVMLRRSTVLRDLGIAVGVAGCAASFLVRADIRLPWLIGFGTTGVALVLLGRDGPAGRVEASLGPEGVVVRDRVVAPRNTIRSGWIERNYQGCRVHVDRGLFSEVEFEASDDVEARTLLRALGCDPSQRVIRFPSSSRFAALAGALGGQFCAHALVGHDGVTTGSVLALSLASCLFWYLLVFVFGRPETSVGSDGVLLHGLVRSRFVPFTDVASVAVESPGKLVIRTRNEEALVRRMKAPAAEAAAELIESAITSAHSGSEAVRLRLRREGESEGDVGVWLARLRSLASFEPYRAAAFGGDALWRVVDDPGATGAERAAAAVVLGAVATPAERTRLRDAAARMASPRVRVAIERVADGAGGGGGAGGAGGARGDGDAELAMAMEALAADSAA